MRLPAVLIILSGVEYTLKRVIFQNGTRWNAK